MFTPGQTVYHRIGKHSGTVLEVDGKTVYLVQPNGVEIEFPITELTATQVQAKTPEAAVAASLSRTLTSRDITAEHRKVLAAIPVRTLQTIATLFEKRPKAGRFSALDVAQKLNFIAEVTDVPYRSMKEFADSPGTLGLMMGRGLSIRLGTAT
jgi:hypothetical protein